MNEQDAYLRGRVQVMVVEKMRVSCIESDAKVVKGFWIPTQDEEISEV